MRIAVTISYTKEWQDLANIAIPNMAEYCVRHGYSLFVTADEYEKYDGLCKMANILRLFSTETNQPFDYVFSFDCDTLVTNHLIKLGSFLEDDKSLFICEGLNMGVFGVKNDNNGYAFITICKELILLGKYDCEQSVINDIGNMASDGLRILKHPAFNSYLSELYPSVPQPVTEEQGQWVEGSFILHLPALPISQRIEIMKNTKITR